MATPQRRGPLSHRILVFLFAASVSVFAFWLIGYVLEDIDEIQGPDRYQMLEQQSPDQTTASRSL